MDAVALIAAEEHAIDSRVGRTEKPQAAECAVVDGAVVDRYPAAIADNLAVGCLRVLLPAAIDDRIQEVKGASGRGVDAVPAGRRAEGSLDEVGKLCGSQRPDPGTMIDTFGDIRTDVPWARVTVTPAPTVTSPVTEIEPLQVVSAVIGPVTWPGNPAAEAAPGVSAGAISAASRASTES